MIILTRLKKTIYHFTVVLISFYTKPRSHTFSLLFEAVQDLGGVYVKFMQFLCLRLDVFDDDIKLQFVSLYDHVAYEDRDIQAILEHEIGAKSDRLSQISLEPFAAGSFAQVYKAVLDNTLPVVIKVRRTDQHQKVAFDFFLLYLVCRVITMVFDFEQIDLLRFLQEFKRTTFQELDYRIEVKHALYLYEQYRHHPQIVIPETFAELSTSTIIVQEFIDGLPLSDVMTLKQESPTYLADLKSEYKIDLKEVFFSIATEVIRQHLTFDKFYADPHPGNIILLPHNRFAFIDFGILDYTATERDEYFSLLKILGAPIEQLDVDGMSQQFLRLGARPLFLSLQEVERSMVAPGVLTQIVKQEYAQLIQEQKAGLIHQEMKKKEDLTHLTLQVAEVGRKFQIEVPLGFFNVIRSSMMFKSYSSYLAPDYHYMRQVYRKIAEEYENASFPSKRNAKKYSFEEASEEVMTWLSSVAEVDLPLYLQIHSVLNKNGYA